MATRTMAEREGALREIAGCRSSQANAPVAGAPSRAAKKENAMPKKMRAEMYKGRTDTEWGRIRMGVRAPDLCPGVDAVAELRAVLADPVAPAILRKLAKKDLAGAGK